MRDCQLTLLAAGGAEVVDVETDEVIWASDSDPDFAEEFPDILDENDLEHILDYLEEHGKMTTREVEACECGYELMDRAGPGDDEDEDDDEDDAWAEEDVIDAEFEED
jgi:hypothetical protein